MAYVDLAEVRTYLGTPAGDGLDDAAITAIIARVSRLIDRRAKMLRASFVSFEAQTLTKYLDGDGWRYLEVPDLLSITTLSVDAAFDGAYSTTVASSAYWLPDTQPYNRIELTGAGATTAFPDGPRTVKIVGTWGIADTCPDDVKQAVIEECVRVFKAREAGYSDVVGVAGDGAVVLSRGLSARTDLILKSYRQWAFA
jgi:hypothetical protein